MILPLIKKISSFFATSHGARPLMKRILSNRAAIIFYHYCGGSVPYYGGPGWSYSHERLEADLVFLKKYFKFVPLSQIIQNCRINNVPSTPQLAITFDDGFDIMRNGTLEVLERHGVKCTSFLITSCVGNKSLMWRHKLCALFALKNSDTVVNAFNELASAFGWEKAHGRADVMRISLNSWPLESINDLGIKLWEACEMPTLPVFLAEHHPYFDENQVDDWLARGHEIGLHTKSHLPCSHFSVDIIEQEIIEPARYLQQRFGQEEIAFSYPFGFRLPRHIEKTLFDDEMFSCALGVSGLSLNSCAMHQLERADCDNGIEFPVFGKTLLKSIIRTL